MASDDDTGTASGALAIKSEDTKAKKAVAARTDFSSLVISNAELLKTAEEELEQALDDEDGQDIDRELAWGYYTLQEKAYTDSVIKLQDQLLKAKDHDGVVALRTCNAVHTRTKVKLEYLLKQKCPTPLSTTTPAAASSLSAVDTLKLKKLPKRDLPKFSGDVREWLSFWAFFVEIDREKNLSDIDKFHYLIQSTVEDTTARKLLQSFPFCSGNYAAALQSLKDRFGRNNVLVKVYVRDLLQLVIEASSGKTMEFGDLVTTITSQIRNLEMLGVTEDKCAQVLYPVVESCLPLDVLQAWQRSSSFKEELGELVKFLQAEVNNLTERNLASFYIGSGSNHSSNGGNKPSRRNGKSGDVPTASSFMNNVDTASNGGERGNRQSGGGSKYCVFCDKSNHSSLECKYAMGMTLKAKRDILKNKRHCFNCLWQMNRPHNNCSVKTKCAICHQKHFVVMCPKLDLALGNGTNSPSQKAKEVPVAVAADPPTSTSSSNVDGQETTTCSNLTGSKTVPLQTLVVTVIGTNGKRKAVRAIMDPGSQRSYVLESLANDLQLAHIGKEEVIHNLFGGKQTQLEKHDIVKVYVADKNNQNICNFDVSTKNLIARQILKSPPGAWVEDYRKLGIDFTDEASSSSCPVELLIGNDVAARIYTGNIRHLEYGPSAMETRWGWVLCGKLPREGESSRHTMMVSDLLNIEGHSLSSLWELESIGIKEPTEIKEKEELAKATQEHFDKTVTQLLDGRYQICLPWISGTKEKLPPNRFIAERRLKTVTRDLQTKGYLEKYHSLFQQWKEEGMIEEVPVSELENKGHYLPHRAVIKLSSSTTPIRPVFDGSSKSKGNHSLNDCLDKGPNLLELIPPILSRFRLKKVGVVADIKKAFQQISVANSDRDYLRFLWWEDTACKKQITFRHCRVVFGVTCSPYTLAAVIRHHLSKASGPTSEVATLLIRSMYVDNAILSVDSLEDGKEFQKLATDLLLPAKFDLRAWEFGPTGEEKITPVLGLQWNLKDDCLSLDVSKVVSRINEPPTLRRVLSLVHAIYDPLGFACPFTIVGKLLLRRCFEEKCGMDTTVSTELSADILKWAAQIPLLENMKVPRHVHFGEDADYSIHVLCDASSLSTAAAVFLRREDKSEVKVFLLAAKARVAPKKKATIPRLELVACVIAARLLRSVLEDIGNPSLPVYLHSDSTTALAWIRGTGPWGVFVTNTVEKVKSLTNNYPWRHIPGKYNIADLPSRGCSANKLRDSRWWEGPTWLYLPPEEWPKSEDYVDQEMVDSERKKTVVVATAAINDHPLNEFLRIAEYPRILKSVAIWLHYKRKLQQKVAEKKSGGARDRNLEIGEIFTPAAKDLLEAEQCVVKYAQMIFYREPGRLKRLKVFTDKDGMIRTKTRLFGNKTEDFVEFECPLVLPDDDEFVRRLVYWEHAQHCHVGATTVLIYLRERFWLVNGRRTVRGVITKCWTCKWFNAKRMTVLEAPLPKDRMNLSAPFTVTGIDAAGPLILKGGEKVWVLLFTCATYRAVHLELIDTLSADGFIRALRKFVARRGRPSVIYSDNACGFVAAHKSMDRASWEKVKEYATVARMQWRFSPPLAPWWGGWWERLIGLMKQLLRRILGKRVVNYAELEMMLVEVEECMNNRPLTYISENAEDPMPLTPNHFLRWSGSIFLPEADVRDASSTRAAYKKLQKLREALRSRFRLEYLGYLRGHTMEKASAALQPGDVVLVEKENCKRQDWQLGVIAETIMGKDGAIRLYRLKTRTGEILRPAQRLFLMEQN